MVARMTGRIRFDGAIASYRAALRLERNFAEARYAALRGKATAWGL